MTNFSIRKKTQAAVFWSSADILARQGLAFLVSIALARMLTPESFGTMALLLLFTGLASVFVDSGFSSALIQRQDVTVEDESTVFWLNFALGMAVAAVLCVIAPLIAEFYGLPILIPLTVVMAFNVVLNALGAIHSTLLTKRLEFKVLMKIGAVASISSGAIALLIAFAGGGLWALVAQTISASLITTVLLWMNSRWRPMKVLRLESVRKLFSFGGYLFASSLLEVIYSRGYALLIGKNYGVRELGYFNRADEIKQLPVGFLGSVVSRVTFPIFSAAANDRLKLKNQLQVAVKGAMLINVPMMFGLMAVADVFVPLVFGDQWGPAVPIVRVLCFVGLIWPLHVLNLNALTAQGYAALYFRLEMAKKIIGIACLIVGAQFGIMGIAWSQAVFGVLALLINSHYSNQLLQYGVVKQLRDIAPPLFLGGLMAILVTVVSIYIGPGINMALKLFSVVVIGGVFYFYMARIFKLRAMEDVMLLIAEKR